MVCAVCWRYHRGFGFRPDVIGIDRPRVTVCSMKCQDVVARFKGMIDPNKHELQALDDAMIASGRFLDDLDKTNLMSFSQQEYKDFIEVIVTAFQDSLRSAYANDPPF